MNTYYTKNADGTFSEALIDSTDAVSLIRTNLINEALAKANKLVQECIESTIDDTIKAKITDSILEHLGTMNIADIVDERVDEAVRDYDYSGMIENAADDVNIDEIVEEKIKDHLDSCSIQVRIS